ncbi:MAG: UDP-N-acetylglucosamine 2-epimerase (non-hydrolyzing) [Acidobacteriota bacterium]|nr:UDP-N-acetylglucosamine 2-epimerase (non-hydrolyzing) [Acidobacteriota bacterium]
MKAAPVLAALGRRAGVEQRLAHTGQHYSANMSDAFFEQLGLPAPDINLEVGSGTHGAQTGQIMIRLEEELIADRPDLLIVYGDVNSTVAAALVGAKLQIPVAHVEAGLRSGDRSMPEEINRLVTDSISRLLFTPSRDGDTNLLSEGTNPAWIHFVGNVMIDSLVRLLPLADPARILNGLGIPSHDRFCLVTLHRPSNVDDVAMLERVRRVLRALAARVPVLFPVHPRTRARMGEGWTCPGLHVLEPLGYLDFIGLQRGAALVVTDSGGVQEETTFLGVPCLTLRENTERPVTIEIGTNTLVGRDTDALLREALRVIDETGEGRATAVPPLWDGRTGERIADVIVSGEWRHSG